MVAADEPLRDICETMLSLLDIRTVGSRHLFESFVEASFFETLVEFTNRFSFSSFRVSFQQYAKTFSRKCDRMRSRHAAAL